MAALTLRVPLNYHKLPLNEVEDFANGVNSAILAITRPLWCCLFLRIVSKRGTKLPL